MLWEAGADMEAADSNGVTPAYIAAYWGRLDALRFLHDPCGCDMSIPKHDGAIAGRVTVHAAAQEGHLDVLKFLHAECGCDMSVQDSEGETPLDVARFGLEPDDEGEVSPFHAAVVEFLTNVTVAVAEPAASDAAAASASS